MKPLIAADYALLEDDRSDSVEEAGSHPHPRDSGLDPAMVVLLATWCQRMVLILVRSRSWKRRNGRPRKHGALPIQSRQGSRALKDEVAGRVKQKDINVQTEESSRYDSRGDGSAMLGSSLSRTRCAP